MTTTPPRSRFRRYGLRSLLALTALAAVVFAYPANVRRQYQVEQSVANRVARMGGRVDYVTIENSWARRLPVKREWLNRVCTVECPKANLDYELIRNLGRLECIETLDLSGSDLDDEGLRALESLDSLRRLNLSRTRVTGTGFAGFKREQLVSLDVANAPICDAGLEQIARLRMLRRLNLSASKVSARGWAPLAALQGLEVLFLQDCTFGDNDATYLSKLSELQFVSLEGTDISDEAIAHLNKLRRLSHVILERTRTSTTGVAQLQQQFPTTRIRFSCEPRTDVRTVSPLID